MTLRLAWIFALPLAVATAPTLAQRPAPQNAKPVYLVGSSARAAYKRVGAALDAAPVQGAVLRIEPGVYREKLLITGNGIELRGLGAHPQDVVLTYDDSAASAGGTGKSGSVTVRGNDFLAENLTIENPWERTHQRTQEGSQAVALMASGDRQVYRNVRLLGFQDTLYAGSLTCHGKDDLTAGPCQAARQLYVDCYIEGHVDFIFGDAKAAFDHCEIHGMKNPTVMLTAQSKLFPAEDSGYLFNNCTVTAADGIGKLILGRPWRTYSTVVYLNTRVEGAVIDPAGWAEWDGRLATSTYAEFNTGPNADVSQRIAPSKQLTRAEAKKITVSNWLAGNDHWDAASVR